MAIFHCVIKTLQRSEGKRVVAAAAYRRAVSMRDYQEGVKYNYEYKRDVVYSEILVPVNAPAWAKALATSDKENGRRFSEKLWNAVEVVEKRKDAQLAREIEFALPIELSQAQNIALAREYLQDQFASRGMIVDWSVHWDQGNPHVHALLTLRELTPEGFGQKVRVWNKRELAVEWRATLCEYLNFHLKLHGHAVTVDHRSYQAQGIDLIPTQHQGKAVKDMERRGITTQIAQQANEVRRENLQRICAKPEVLFHKIGKERETFTYQDMGHEMGKYVNDRQTFLYGSSSQASLASSCSLPAGLLAGRLLQEIKGRQEFEITSLEALGQQRCLTPKLIARILQEIERHDSVFKEQDLAKALLPVTSHAKAFAQALFEIKASDQIIALGLGEDGRERWTTKRLFALENKLQQLAQRLSETRHRPIEKLRTAELLKTYERETGKTLTAEQRAAVKHLAGQKALRCLVGRAGTGKSFTLGAARFIWEASGLKVQGIALSGVAARNLSQASGIASRTIESLRYALEKGKLALGPQDVVVMDEAGMTDSPALLAVLSAVQKAKAKLVLAGDPQQLQPVGAGASFRAIASQAGFAELQEVYRQKTDWQREATALLAKGQTDRAIELYRRHLCVHLAPDRVLAMAALLKDWRQRWERLPSKTLSSLLVLTHRHEDVQQINQFIRAILREDQVLSEDVETGASRGRMLIAQGERLLLLQNNAFLGVKNGDFGTVSGIELTEGGKLLRFALRLDQGGQEIVIDPLQYGHFDYGYSATVHKAQGLTVDHTFVYAGSCGWDRHLSYVAMSRHRLSCGLYASCETYQDMTALKKGLERGSLKDSVIDYPLAFAKRRGITLFKGLEIAIGKRLAGRLKVLSIQFASTLEEAISPSRYWAKKTAQAKALQTEAETAQRRKDAVQVAAYAEANRACGTAFEVYAQKATSLGIDLNDKQLSPEIYQLLAKLPETMALRKALSHRNYLAGLLYAQLGRYTQALEIYQIKTAVLARQSDSHQFWTTLKLYQQLNKENKSVLRDKRAFELCGSLKAHYPFIKAANVDVKALRCQAKAHERKLLLKSLDSQGKADFKHLETYRETCQAIYALMQRLIPTTPAGNPANILKKSHAVFAKNLSKPDNIVPKALSEKSRVQWQALTERRNALAAEIYTHPERFEAALNFYDYGQARPPSGFDKTGENAQRYARNRWYKLVNHAAQHMLSQKIADYRKSEDPKVKQALAWDMLQDSEGYKTCYPALLHAQTPVNDFWKAVRKDAKAHERGLFFEGLNEHEQKDFTLVERYAQEKRTAGLAWRAFFERQALAESASYPLAAQPIPPAPLKPDEKLHQALGDEIFKDVKRYEKYFALFQIDPVRLEKAAQQHRCRQQVIEYQQAFSRLAKGRLAQEMLKDPKAYAFVLREHGISWKALYSDAGIAERQDLFKTLTLEEKRFLRDAYRCKQSSRKAGKAYRQLTLHQTSALNKERLSALQAKAESLIARRDCLAYCLQEKRDLLAFAQIGQTEASAGLQRLDKAAALDEKKLIAQSERHRLKLALVRCWQDDKRYVQQALEKSLQCSEAEKAYRDGEFLRALKAMAQDQDYARLSQRPLSFRDALRETGESSDSIIRWKAVCAWIEKRMQTERQSLRERRGELLDTERFQRIQKAQGIAQGTCPIEGTLAERYLREHRGITGELPKSLRYHPAHYNHLAGQKTPALVVLARNAKAEIQAVQVISLDPKTAQKAFGKQSKLTFGALSQAGVLINAGRVEKPVIIAEGPETALSVAQAMPDHTVYAALGAGSFGCLPLGENVKQVIFAADNDGADAASVKQLKNAADTLSQAGKDVYRVMPKAVNTDFNDVLKTAGVEAVEALFDKPKLLTAACLTLDPQDAVLSTRELMRVCLEAWQTFNTALVKSMTCDNAQQAQAYSDIASNASHRHQALALAAAARPEMAALCQQLDQAPYSLQESPCANDIKRLLEKTDFTPQEMLALAGYFKRQKDHFFESKKLALQQERSEKRSY